MAFQVTAMITIDETDQPEEIKAVLQQVLAAAPQLSGFGIKFEINPVFPSVPQKTTSAARSYVGRVQADRIKIK